MLHEHSAAKIEPTVWAQGGKRREGKGHGTHAADARLFAGLSHRFVKLVYHPAHFSESQQGGAASQRVESFADIFELEIRDRTIGNWLDLIDMVCR